MALVAGLIFSAVSTAVIGAIAYVPAKATWYRLDLAREGWQSSHRTRWAMMGFLTAAAAALVLGFVTLITVGIATYFQPEFSVGVSLSQLAAVAVSLSSMFGIPLLLIFGPFVAVRQNTPQPNSAEEI